MAQFSQLLPGQQQPGITMQQRQVQLAMEQSQAIRSITGVVSTPQATPINVQAPVADLNTSEAVESEILLNAAQQVLLQVGRPMHYTDINRVILEKNLARFGAKLTLEAALFREIQKPGNARFLKVEGQPGVFGLQGQIQRPVKPIKHHKYKHRPTAAVHASLNGMTSKDKNKYIKLKRLIKNMIFLNAAVCDEVTRVEEKILRVKEERRFLLRKVLQQQTASDVANQVAGKQTTVIMSQAAAAVSPFATTKATAASSLTSQSSTDSTADPDKTKIKKKPPAKKKGQKEILDESLKPKPKKTAGGKSASGKRLVQPIPLDNTGRPVFPMEFGDLTIYSVGEIIPDKVGFHSTDHIFPVGFCSTRIYASLQQPDAKCLYTCKIWEGKSGPKFEISPEDCPDHVFSSDSPSACHNRLLQALNQSRGIDIVETRGKGPEFFGLTHPTVQNLIQSCPGARKCSGYKWVKFEIAKTEAQALSASEPQDDPSVHYDALSQSPAYLQAAERQKLLRQQMAALEPTTSLRSLLTSGPMVQPPPT